MRYYNRIKNIILAGFAGAIYIKYIVPNVPVLNKFFAVVFVCAMTLSVVEDLDEKNRAKIRAKREARKKENERIGMDTVCTQTETKEET